ncbi:MAG: histidine--tRNA ligase [Sphingomonadaceae bacterium]|nr:histidine--tRNA ligase [Sphingomonadaceae bacterium]
MSDKIQAVRGMNDIAPSEIPYWRFIEDTARRVLDAYGFREIRMPIVEKTDLFRRSIGEVTDIVEKEMYTFPDRRGDSLTLRPEATASMVRAGVQHNLFDRVRRLWCTGPMFRYERPQKGRYRQFHQLDVEVFGVPGAEVDAELILILSRLWRELGMQNLALEINSLGSKETQARYRQTLVDFFQDYREQLDEDSTRRLTTNPLRILDSKNPEMRQLIESAPKLIEQLDAESREHFEMLKQILSNSAVPFTVNPRLVRGLDYYRHTAFEFITDRLGAQGTVLGGGRYDGLMESLGGQPTPAVGWAAGIERLAMLVGDGGGASGSALEIAVVAENAAYENAAIALATLYRRRGFSAETAVTGSPRKRYDRAKKLDPAVMVSLDLRDGVRVGTIKLLKEQFEKAGEANEIFETYSQTSE